MSNEYHGCSDGLLCTHGLPRPPQWKAIEWSRHAATSVVVDDQTVFTGKRVIAECETPEDARLIADALEMLEVLRQIVHHYDQTYDADCEPGGSWTSAANIPVAVMERAEALVKKHS